MQLISESIEMKRWWILCLIVGENRKTFTFCFEKTIHKNVWSVKLDQELKSHTHTCIEPKMIAKFKFLLKEKAENKTSIIKNAQIFLENWVEFSEFRINMQFNDWIHFEGKTIYIDSMWIQLHIFTSSVRMIKFTHNIKSTGMEKFAI